MEDTPYRLLSLTGFFVIAALAWVNDALIALIDASRRGSVFLFGPLALGPGESRPDGTQSIGFVLAMQVLPAVIFFAALIAGLYHLRVMQPVVRFFARLFYRGMGLSGAEALSASANLFVGIESSLTVRPYLERMTRSELLTLLTCMMATVASTVLAVYVLALQNVFPQIAGHLVSASLISIPCAILISKLALPETEPPVTAGEVPDDTAYDGSETPPANLMVALMDGGRQGVGMAVGIATLLIVVLGLEAVLDLLLRQLPAVAGADLTLARILGWLTWPFVVLLGLRPEEWQLASEILGSRFVETEVTAYFTLAAVQGGEIPAFSPRSLTVLTYALCGFVHIASMGIFIGGVSSLMPQRVREVSVLGLRALWTSFLATLLTGCVAGVLA
ncbi:NupC/NupG family nucleoside CNT transporter [Nitrospina watsonii]|uniref:Nucleoside permease nupX n=1 Tax=Nitrospina watsonii TaxID=1323948 RepID=A0ABN8VVB2_9BACT|nr:nucleoside transporter C-terminal domain-containing protein [Nitrospina watsonii]CAI2717618.1 Putative Nucleoside permease nupX [Nitrospina watsonii]